MTGRSESVIAKVSNLPFGRTDCALPMVWALRKGMEIDHFCVYTDNETWAGTIHPHQALAKYRRKTGIPARLSVVGMTATDFTIADPEDPGSLDVAGFDSAVPSLLGGFARGDI
jgi:60 kDa SS-A/Ro ribonucleoprotein